MQFEAIVQFACLAHEHLLNVSSQTFFKTSSSGRIYLCEVMRQPSPRPEVTRAFSGWNAHAAGADRIVDFPDPVGDRTISTDDSLNF